MKGNDKLILSLQNQESLQENAIHIKTRAYSFADWCTWKELAMEGMKKIIWTDSQCALNWLTSKKPLSVFVKNYFAEITKEKNLEFRYINIKDNPADIPSRWMNSTELKDCLLWWNGLKWLEEDSTC